MESNQSFFFAFTQQKVCFPHSIVCPFSILMLLLLLVVFLPITAQLCFFLPSSPSLASSFEASKCKGFRCHIDNSADIMDGTGATEWRDSCLSCVLHVSQSNTLASANAEERCLSQLAIPICINQSKWVSLPPPPSVIRSFCHKAILVSVFNLHACTHSVMRFENSHIRDRSFWWIDYNVRYRPFMSFSSHISVYLSCFLSFLSSLASTEPFTEYRIIVIAFTLKYDGEPSDSVTLRTDIPGPSAPQIINLTCHSQDALFIHWKRPSTFYNSIDSYVINYKESVAGKFDELRITTNSSVPDSWVSFTSEQVREKKKKIHTDSLEGNFVTINSRI